MGYERAATAETPKGGPHPDARKNDESFQKQMSYVRWLNQGVNVEVCGPKSSEIQTDPDGRQEMASRITEAMYLLFSWKDGRDNRMTINISFQQPNGDFVRELCGAINKLGGLGFLDHRKKDNQGYHRKEPITERNMGDWDKLFGGVR